MKIFRILLKVLLGILAGIFLVIILLVIFLGPVGKYVIEHKSEQFTGRLITLDKLKINLFTGKINVYGLRVIERDKKTDFVRINHLFADIDMGKIIKPVYRIEHLHLEDPYIHIDQKGMTFNFDDLLTRFSSDTIKKTKAEKPTEYFLEDVLVKGGKINYNNHDYTLIAGIEKFQANSKGMAWNNPLLSMTYGFNLQSGGTFNGAFTLDMDKLTFSAENHIREFNLSVLLPYLTPLRKVKKFEGYLSVDMENKGNFTDPKAIAVSGKIDLDRFKITDGNGTEMTGFRNFRVVIDSMDIARNTWKFGTISLDEPYIRYELYPEGDNFSLSILTDNQPAQTSAVHADSNVKTHSAGTSNPFLIIADYVKEIAKDLIITDYKVKQISISNGKADYFDHTLQETFALNVHDLNFDIRQINSGMGRATADLTAGINRKGLLIAEISINPNDFLDFEIKYDIREVNMSDYNPYSIYYVAHPSIKGKFNYTGTVIVKNHQLKSDHKVLIEKIVMGKKIKNQTAVNLPIRLAVAILRDPKGNISFDIPVEGDLDNPHYKLKKVIIQVLENIIIKAATAPYNLLAGVFGGKEEEFKEVVLDHFQGNLNERQLNQVSKLINAMLSKPELRLEFRKTGDPAKEIELLSYFNAKTRYYFDRQKTTPVPDSLSAMDLDAINKINTTDTAFIHYLNMKIGDYSPLNSTMDKCIRMIGRDLLEKILNRQEAKRDSSLVRFVREKGLPGNRYNITKSKDPAEIPEDKLPRYLIFYSVPEEH
ncbi:MAG: DUF748 domain-containing protein [Bacteroidetes bacterium]|nr:DUF748 domain-containing protein [Bacteroidota bacterium]